MSKSDILQFFVNNASNLTVMTIVGLLAMALLIGGLICLTYYFAFRGVAYNSRLNITLVMMTLLSCVIMMMISSNIVISLGMVGALSIIRFRTAMKDSRDTVYIFWAMTEGLCIGSQNLRLALVTTLFIASIMLAVSFLSKFYHKYLLVLTATSEQLDMLLLTENLKKMTAWSKLRTLTKDDKNTEIVFELIVRQPLSPETIDQILSTRGVTSANLVEQAGETLG